MNSKILMRISAIFLSLMGIAFSFLPQEIAELIGLPFGSILIWQIISSFYFSFAILNWLAKDNLIGGIYSKPVAFANFMHFGLTAFNLIKFFSKNTEVSPYLAGISIIYLLLAIGFTIIFFGDPLKNQE